MKKQYAVFLLTLVLALGVAAMGQSLRPGVVNVPFEFQAAGKTLPAGTYRIAQLSGSGLEGLMLSNYEGRTSVFVLPNQFQASAGSNVKVAFEEIGDQHVLSSIETPNGVFSFHLPASATAFAKAKHVDGAATAGAQ